ncbi:hypothetical protein MUK42_35238 [Musa troglodytarum]|uniref:Uncharacterized protein n=1 Tax=Musa troglodytarum TaxID=320322 RepID=A0A9E7KSU5_9LILI|nr:hypothetical protein MUK42_35250 [Musa troglodytarum]URE28176.1 hypothetical protein MUK42_35238 [Musa troglodytarum]
MGNWTHLLHPLPPDLVAGRLVGDEADALNLAVVVEANDADEGIRVLLALFELLRHLCRIDTSEHGNFF